MEVVVSFWTAGAAEEEEEGDGGDTGCCTAGRTCMGSYSGLVKTNWNGYVPPAASVETTGFARVLSGGLATARCPLPSCCVVARRNGGHHGGQVAGCDEFDFEMDKLWYLFWFDENMMTRRTTLRLFGMQRHL
jgi:hypothetical protein